MLAFYLRAHAVRRIRWRQDLELEGGKVAGNGMYQLGFGYEATDLVRKFCVQVVNGSRIEMIWA